MQIKEVVKLSKSVKRNKLLTTKQIKIYCNLEWLGKTKRLRKKAYKILEHDSYLDMDIGEEDLGMLKMTNQRCK